MIAPEGDEEQFEFYLKVAKPLILNLSNTNDRIKAAAWVRYLKHDITDPVLRSDYLKLLLFVLQKRKLFGPFASIPDESKPLPNFPPELSIQDIAKHFIDVDNEMTKVCHYETMGKNDWPPYATACSADLTKYVARQEIPNYGMHAYFAISKEPLQYWRNSHKAIFPLGETLNATNAEYIVTETTSPNISCFVSPDEEEPPAPTPVSPRIIPNKIKAPEVMMEDELGQVSGVEISGQENAFQMGARVPPTWGSNLVNVQEPFSFSSLQVKDFDIDLNEGDMVNYFDEDLDEDFDDELSYYDFESENDEND